MYSRLLNEVTPAVPELVERRAGAGAERADRRGRGDRAPARRHAPSLPDDDEPLRPPARRRWRRGGRSPLTLFAVRPPLPRRRLAHGRAARPPGGRAGRVRCPRRCACRVSSPAHPSAARGIPRARARARPRGDHGEGAGRALRGRPPRDATFAVDAAGVSVVPSRPGRALDVIGSGDSSSRTSPPRPTWRGSRQRLRLSRPRPPSNSTSASGSRSSRRTTRAASPALPTSSGPRRSSTG